MLTRRMKLHIKEKMRKISNPEITYLKPPSQQVKTKGASKKVKPIPMTIQRCGLLPILNMLTNFFRILQLQNLKKVLSKEHA